MSAVGGQKFLALNYKSITHNYNAAPKTQGIMLVGPSYGPWLILSDLHVFGAGRQGAACRYKGHASVARICGEERKMHVTQSVRARRRLAAIRTIGWTSAAALTAGFLSASASASYVYSAASADAEIREIQPEFTRGSPLPPASGSSTQVQELQISSNPLGTGSVNRNLGLMRFTIPSQITSSADLLNFAEIRVFWRHQTQNGRGALRLYALAPTNAKNTTWDEANVMYRDTGNFHVVVPTIGSNQTFTPNQTQHPNPSQGLVVQNWGTNANWPMPDLMNTGAPPPAPAAPDPVGSNGEYYGADMNHPRSAPGILYENPPLSQQVVNENAARYTYNLNQKAGYDADIADGDVDGDGSVFEGLWAYLPYINQPGYNMGTTTTLAVGNAISVGDGNPNTTSDGYTNIYSDVPESNMPFLSGPTNSFVDDLDTSANGWQYMGYLNLDFTSTGVGSGIKLGKYASFGSVGGMNIPDAETLNVRANLVAFLGYWIDQGYREFTFMIGPGIGVNASGGPIPGVEWLNNVNLQIASKEYANATPPSGFPVINAGDLAPLLVLAPEPTSLALLGLGAAGLLIRRRR